MKEFTITITSGRTSDSKFLDTLTRDVHAGPIMQGTEPEAKKENQISAVTITARLVDVEYSEAQALLEQMKADAKKA